MAANLTPTLFIDDMKKWLMRCQKYQPYSNILCAGYTMAMLNISKKIEPKKQELLKKVIYVQKIKTISINIKKSTNNLLFSDSVKYLVIGNIAILRIKRCEAI